jgi:hypothetical protein
MLSTYKNKKMHGARMYTCNIAYKIQLLIIINKDKNEPITIAFIKENTIVNEVVKVRRTENDLHAVLINTVIHKLYGFSICYWVQIGFLKYRFKDYCHYYNKDIALIELETIGDWFDVTLRTFFKTVQNKYEQSEGRALTVGKKRGDELSFLSHGFHNINTVYSMIDMFDDSDTAERKTIASVCSTMLTEMSLKEQLQLRELLQEKNKKYHDNALYNIVIDTIARGE